jgi:tRNA U54 and U55 pseudouridine synthase Pus10
MCEAVKESVNTKRKAYRCVVYASRRLTQADLDRTLAVHHHGLVVQQKTPLRVLHR